ncbi:protein of unknown function [Candidatus Filomicrobium marinum]|uniref:Flagellar protein FlgJ N-terminal domain-containing protein n=1 Tax=Candidatus Filomicrobium marinum TaxID=1608628 RepID=A0A0D6JKI3_9HYPH|nr:rod-binding protein [Candidatus Filomicrobium marinum]CFX55039.1 protein of unknown function [Candidatus Filomicrobium marinum]CPR22170.1 protein of unknown function [Candidatus Filomicrobium marinum]
MGINPSTDLIVDVMRQADPVKVREAAERLAEVGRAVRVERLDANFASLVKDAIGEGETLARSGGGAPQGPVQVVDSHPGVRMAEKLAPGQQLESFVLTQLLENMMPKDADSLFGSGTAGSYWRSMLAEKLAAELTMAGGVGLTEQLGLSGMRDDPKMATAMLGAVLNGGRASAATAEEVVPTFVHGGSAARAIQEIMSPVEGTHSAEPETNGV